MHCPTLDHECPAKIDSHAEWKCDTQAWHHSLHYKLFERTNHRPTTLCMRGPHITTGSLNPQSLGPTGIPKPPDITGIPTPNSLPIWGWGSPKHGVPYHCYTGTVHAFVQGVVTHAQQCKQLYLENGAANRPLNPTVRIYTPPKLYSHPLTSLYTPCFAIFYCRYSRHSVKGKSIDEHVFAQIQVEQGACASVTA